MPTLGMLSLTDAIKALPQAAIVQVSIWQPAMISLPGLVQGEWGPWIELSRPYTVSWNSAATTYTVTTGGEEYLKACSVYCTGGLPIELVQPSSRTARVRVGALVNGVAVFKPEDVYRVMEVRSWPAVSDHAEIHCRRDLGEAAVQA
jgi:hypothetical protein